MCPNNLDRTPRQNLKEKLASALAWVGMVAKVAVIVRNRICSWWLRLDHVCQVLLAWWSVA
jgi:hypothetical protein